MRVTPAELLLAWALAHVVFIMTVIIFGFADVACCVVIGGWNVLASHAGGALPVLVVPDIEGLHVVVATFTVFKAGGLLSFVVLLAAEWGALRFVAGCVKTFLQARRAIHGR